MTVCNKEVWATGFVCCSHCGMWEMKVWSPYFQELSLQGAKLTGQESKRKTLHHLTSVCFRRWFVIDPWFKAFFFAASAWKSCILTAEAPSVEFLNFFSCKISIVCLIFKKKSSSLGQNGLKIWILSVHCSLFPPMLILIQSIISSGRDEKNIFWFDWIMSPLTIPAPFSVVSGLFIVSWGILKLQLYPVLSFTQKLSLVHPLESPAAAAATNKSLKWMNELLSFMHCFSTMLWDGWHNLKPLNQIDVICLWAVSVFWHEGSKC